MTDEELQSLARQIRSGFVSPRHVFADDIQSAVLCALFAHRTEHRGVLILLGRRAAVDEIRRQTKGTMPRSYLHRRRQYNEAEAALRGRWRMEPSREAVLRRLRETQGWTDTIVRNFLAGPPIAGSKDAENDFGQSPEDALCAADPAPDAAKELLRREDAEALRTALSRLPPVEQETVERRYLLGWKLEKVAETLGVSTQRVWQIERSALAKLRRRLGGAPKNL